MSGGNEAAVTKAAAAAKNVTAKSENGLPQKAKKLPQKPEVEPNFAVDFFSEDEDFSDSDFFAADGVDSKVWRIEKRYRNKQDGTLMLYYNYRQRKGKIDKKTGKRVNRYKPGGNRTLS